MIRLADVERALTLEIDGLAAQLTMAPAIRAKLRPETTPRPAAVLILLYPTATGHLNIILTKRTDHLRGHSGQISFPGGKADPEDTSPEATALRETCEELGICDQHNLLIVGRLTRLWIPPSNFEVVPIVGYASAEPVITPSPAEVAQVLRLPLYNLLDAGQKRSTPMRFGTDEVDVPYYDVDGHVVWGATCMMLSELEQRLRRVLD